MSNAFDFNKDLKRERRDIHAKEWSKISELFNGGMKVKFNEEGFVPNKDIIIKIPDKNKEITIESKVDYYPYTGNVIIELVSSTSLENIPFDIYSKSSFTLSPIEYYHKILSEKINKNACGGRRGIGIALDSDIRNNHFLLMIYINSDNKIVKQAIFKSRDVRDYIKRYNKNFDYVVTKSKSNNRYWATISNKLNLDILLKNTKSLFYTGSIEEQMKNRD